MAAQMPQEARRNRAILGPKSLSAAIPGPPTFETGLQRRPIVSSPGAARNNSPPPRNHFSAPRNRGEMPACYQGVRDDTRKACAGRRVMQYSDAVAAIAADRHRSAGKETSDEILVGLIAQGD